MRWARLILLLFLALGACSPGGPDPLSRAAPSPIPSPEPPPKQSPKPRATRMPEPTPAPIADASSPRWVEKIDRLVKELPISIAFSHQGTPLYRKGARNKRVPASVQKLPLTMALFETLGPHTRIETTIAARHRSGDAIKGDVWILGGGDPTVTGSASYASAFPFRATDVRALASALARAGVSEITGSIVGSKTPFARDWHAPGWRSHLAGHQIAFPSALTLNGNVHKGQFTRHPERLLAEHLTKLVRRRGITVAGSARAGLPPKRLKTIATVRSPELRVLARYMNRQSSNFFAEVLGKRLGLEAYGAPGTIAKAARAISDYARRRNVVIDSRDCSGLSYDNKVSPKALVRLLVEVETQPWWSRLRRGLPKGGIGTLEDRLFDVRVRAKTGTLVGISALAGWVWLEKVDDWAAFAIMSRGLDKARAIELENRIVGIVSRRAQPPRLN